MSQYYLLLTTKATIIHYFPLDYLSIIHYQRLLNTMNHFSIPIEIFLKSFRGHLPEETSVVVPEPRGCARKTFGEFLGGCLF